MYLIRKILNPEMFQGGLKKKRYFEGWYFKIVDKGMDNIYGVIPGVSYSDPDKESHCFIQFLDGIEAKSKYFRYPIDEFSFSRKRFEINIANSRFSREGMHLDIDDGSISIRSDLLFSGTVRWPKKFLNPGAMGWYSFLPFMECYHGVVSMDHTIGGTLGIDKKTYDFTEGRGYIEKDWGSSFPEGWVWMQSNNFSKKRVSIMLSIAKIPLRSRTFTGFICGLLVGDDFYRFTTYNGSIIRKLKIGDNKVRVEIVSGKKVLLIEAVSLKSAVLASPRQGSMEGRIDESMDSEMDIRFKEGNKIIYEGKGFASGLEIVNPGAIL